MKCQFVREFDPFSFLAAVDRCTDDVVYESPKGDRLNLKSQLCKALFLTLKPGEAYLRNGSIECCSEDSKILSSFLLIPELTGTISKG